MNKFFFFAAIAIFQTGCQNGSGEASAGTARSVDTLTYAFKATYSSDVTVPASAENAQKVLRVWKAFEQGQILAMKPYFADTVIYDDASGMRFHGPVDQLLDYAQKDIGGLDSMRFDISQWQSSHINDKDEDWINIWSTERRYHKNGKADTVLMQENWKIKGGRIVYFNQYLAHCPR